MEHSFNTAIAGKFGILSAVLVANIKFWIDKNKANNVHFHEGRYWTYNSSAAFSQLFQYATESQIRYALKKLRDEGILMTGNFSDDAKSRTLWYAFTDKGEAMLENPETFFSMEESQGDPQMDQTESPAKDVDDLEAMRQDSQMHPANLANASDNSSKCICQNSQMHLSIFSDASDKFLKSFIVTDNKQQIVNTDGKPDVNADVLQTAQQKAAPAGVEALILSNGREWRPTEEMYDEYCRLYPAVDIAGQFRAMRAWCLGNPGKRKTASGIKRFVNSWLSREQRNQDGGSRAGGGRQPQAPERLELEDELLALLGGQ